MSVGTSQGGACYATQLEAANSWCSSYLVQMGSGTVMTCNAVSGALSDVGGAVVFSFTRRAVDSGGAVSTMSISGQQLPECETYGYDYYAPVIAAFFVAAVAITAAKRVYKWVFTR